MSSAKLPPGVVGAQQLMRGGPLAGYFQPVEIKAPAGALVSLAIDNQFSAAMPAPLKVGMLVGGVYRLQVIDIPNRSGEEVYPTVEIINRIYPPVGEEFRFPVPIELTQADLELALSGKFVTRVIYLEDPQQALPVAETPKGEQRYFEVRPSDDPLEVADRLGRPVAIVRLGGRLPDAGGPDEQFLFGSPPVLVPNSLDVFAEPIADAGETEGIERVVEVKPGKPPIASATASTRRDSSKQPIARRNTASSPVQLAASTAPEPKPDPTVTKSSPSPAVRLAAGTARQADLEAARQAVWKMNRPAPVAVSVTDD